jgi:hypothetical protein
MTLRARLLARSASVAAAVALGLVAAVVVASPASAATATFTKVAAWNTGYVGNMTVRNNTATPITSWRVEFDLPPGTTIPNHWSAQGSWVGNHYVFTSLPWNGNLPPNASTTFGWNAQGLGEPFNCTVNGAPCGGGPADTVAPSTPTNFRATSVTPVLTLAWSASTDNIGVTGYEVLRDGAVIATVTGLTYSQPTPPPMVVTFGVRAFDAAGNRSPAATVTFGSVVDFQPPTAPSNLRLTFVGSQATLAWNASTDNMGVVRYDVALNGSFIGSTQATSFPITLPTSAPAVYTWRVVAYDAAGNPSPPGNFMIAVDPAPSPSRSTPAPVPTRAPVAP